MVTLSSVTIVSTISHPRRLTVILITIALKVVGISMDSDHYDQSKLGRYGKTGYLYQIDNPTNPDTGERTPDIMAGTIELTPPIPWVTS